MKQKLKLKINKRKRYLLACSFGPDSMALLNSCVEQNFDVVVAHVNYHHRKEANKEEKSLREYCKLHSLKLIVDNTKNKKPIGNFEAWARKERYNFFVDNCKKLKLDGILVAHHKDDLIETFLMQKKRDKYYENLGLVKTTYFNNIKIIRPFLKYEKDELLDYCKVNNVPYSIDKTNLQDLQERNQIRHSIIEKLNSKEKSKIIKEINKKKKRKTRPNNVYKIQKFLGLDYEEIVQILAHYMSKLDDHKNISRKFVDSLKKSLISKQPNLEFKITQNLSLFKCYDYIYLINTSLLKDYKIQIKKAGFYETEFLKLKFNENSLDRNIKKSDFPLIIKNVLSNEQITISGYKVEARRLMIDWKMPLFLRKVWPSIYNKENKLIYIPRYKDKFKDNHKTKFEINISFFLA